VLNPGAGIF